MQFFCTNSLLVGSRQRVTIARNIFIFQTPAASIKNHTETLISFTAVQ